MFAAMPAALLTHSAAWSCAALSMGMIVGASRALAVLLGWRRASRRPRTAEYARAALPLGLSQLAVAVGTRFDKILAGALSGLIAAGTFEGAWRIYQLGQYVGRRPRDRVGAIPRHSFARGQRHAIIRLVGRLGGALFAIGTGLTVMILLARAGRPRTGGIFGTPGGARPPNRGRARAARRDRPARPLRAGGQRRATTIRPHRERERGAGNVLVVLLLAPRLLVRLGGRKS